MPIIEIKCTKCKRILQEVEADYEELENGEYGIGLEFDYETFDEKVSSDTRDPRKMFYECPYCKEELPIATRETDIEDIVTGKQIGRAHV